MTALLSPVKPHEIPKAMRSGLEDICRRVVTSAAAEGAGSDLLFRVYLAGMWHGADLSPRLEPLPRATPPVEPDKAIGFAPRPEVTP